MDLVPTPGAWPLSAAATTLLSDLRAAPPALLRASLRELVVRGVLRVEVEQRHGQPEVVRLAPGERDAAGLPAPLHLLAEALRPHLELGGTPAATAVPQASGWRGDLAARVRQAAREELLAAGLLALERSRLFGVVPRTREQLTPSGRAWARSAADVGGTSVAAGALPAAGRLLALDHDLQRRLRDAGTAGDGGGAHVGWGDDELDHLDTVLDGAGPGLDGAADGGSGGSGGGDGGGDGGGGGD